MLSSYSMNDLINKLIIVYYKLIKLKSKLNLKYYADPHNFLSEEN